MNTKNDTEPAATAFRMSMPSMMPAYLHQPRCNPKHAIAVTRITTRMGSAERKMALYGRVKSNRNNQANSKAQATRQAWNTAMNQGLRLRSIADALLLEVMGLSENLKHATTERHTSNGRRKKHQQRSSINLDQTPLTVTDAKNLARGAERGSGLAFEKVPYAVNSGFDVL